MQVVSEINVKLFLTDEETKAWLHQCFKQTRRSRLERRYRFLLQWPSSSPGTVCLAILRNYAHPQRRPCSACVCVRLTQTLPAPNVAAQETEAESDQSPPAAPGALQPNGRKIMKQNIIQSINDYGNQ